MKWITLALAAITGQAFAQPFTVLDGDTQAVIVYQRDATGEAEKAWRDLAAYLKRATGREFQAVSERGIVEDCIPKIHVGETGTLPFEDRRALRDLDRDAYLVHVTPTDVYLAGPRPWSTYWAVCQFLEDAVGVRWLIPGPLGEDVPTHDSLTVPTGRQVFEPVIASRLWSGAHYAGDWNLRQRIHGRYRFHHNLLHVFDAERDYDAHPEWFPLRNGERYRPGPDDHSWQPCFASESSVKHAAEMARQAFEADPDLESFSYGCNDGQGWCECEGCRAMDRPAPRWEGFEGTYSYRYYAWLNKVAAELEKTHPDKLLGCLAYSTYIIPPERIGLHRNIIPYLTSNRADYRDPAFRKKDQALLEWWGRVANQMGIYDYAYGMGFAIPRIYSHLFQGAIRHAVSNGVKGFYAEVYPNWGLDGPKLYLMARVLWDPEADIDALENDWNERMFREAAEPMKRYFARCERAWNEQKTGRGHWAYRLAADPKQFEVFPPAVMDECTRYLDQAAKLAQSDLVRERVRFFRKTWDVTLLLGGGYWAAREVQELIDRGAPVEKVAAAVRKMAEKVATTDVDAYMKERVGDDPIAFHPPQQGWIAPLKAGATTNAKRWSAANIAEGVVREAQRAGVSDAGEIRRQISVRVDEVFGSGGSDNYQATVADIRAMALKVVRARRIETPPAIDGDVGDPVWQDGDVLSGFAKWGETAPSRYETKARLLHDGANLYLALDCAQDTSAMVTDAAPRDGRTWRDDSVEVFINPGMSEFPYVQFIVNAAGAFFDQWGLSAHQSYQERLSANFDCSWATKISPDRWTAELRLPLAQFGCKPADHPMLRLDLVRNVQGKDAEISAWFPSVGAHADPLSRGWLVFE